MVGGRNKWSRARLRVPLGPSVESSPDHPDAKRSTSVLIIDESEPFTSALERDLIASGITTWTARSFPAARVVMNSRGPASFVVSELRVNGRYLIDFMKEVTSLVPAQRFVVGTLYPSVATAVILTRMGVAGYLTKPISAAALLEILGEQRTPDLSAVTNFEPMAWPTLDRTIWEYLSHVHAASGSISEAARRLGVDRRSLRRMLTKYPPTH